MAFPGTYNFNYYRGDTNQFVLRPKNADGSAFNLTGYSAQFKVANRRGSTGTQYPFTATINTSTNIITCTIDSQEGESLTAGTWVYDVQITNSAPDPDLVLTLVTGSITVTDHITGAVES
jgi:hypothetical protein